MTVVSLYYARFSKNGVIRGFLGGIFLENSGGSQGHLVDGIRADHNTFIGSNRSGLDWTGDVEYIVGLGGP